MVRDQKEIKIDLEIMINIMMENGDVNYLGGILRYVNSLNIEEKSELEPVLLEFIQSDCVAELSVACTIIKDMRCRRIIPSVEEILFRAEKGSNLQYNLMMLLLEMGSENVYEYVMEYLDGINYISDSYINILRYLPNYNKEEYVQKAYEYIMKALQNNINMADLLNLLNTFLRQQQMIKDPDLVDILMDRLLKSDYDTKVTEAIDMIYELEVLEGCGYDLENRVN